MKGEYVLKQIQLNNFRSLKDTGLQNLSPITLLVGENSSGKSSFLRSFPLLKQSINKRTSGPILWAGDVDDYVDFGSFEETVTNDQSYSIDFRFKFNIPDLDDDFYRTKKITNIDNIDYKICVSSNSVNDNDLDFVSNFIISINSFTLNFDFLNKKILSDDFSLDFNDTDNIRNDKGLLEIFDISYQKKKSNAFGFELPSIWGYVENIFKQLGYQEEIQQIILFNEVLNDIGGKLIRNNSVTEIINIKSKDGKLKNKYKDKEFNKLYSELIKLIEDNLYLQTIVKTHYVYDVFTYIDSYIVNYYKNVHYIAPLRATAERYYRLRNLAVDEVDYQGKNLAVFINSLSNKKIKEFQNWTSKHFGFFVSIDRSKGHLSLLVRLNNSDKKINLSDTGFGYSQVLPIITQLWEIASRPRSKQLYYAYKGELIPLIVAIEQPELHLHPAMQARLTKAFIASIDLARENGYELQLLLETHSETIVNYIGREITRGHLSNEDVSVIIFNKNDNGITSVSNSRFDVDGYLLDWPYGFFEPEE